MKDIWRIMDTRFQTKTKFWIQKETLTCKFTLMIMLYYFSNNAERN